MATSNKQFDEVWTCDFLDISGQTDMQTCSSQYSGPVLGASNKMPRTLQVVQMLTACVGMAC